MRACLPFALLSLTLSASSCGAIPSPPSGWPAIWPAWEHDPAEVLDVPPAPEPGPAGADLDAETAPDLPALPDTPAAMSPNGAASGHAPEEAAAREEEPSVVPAAPALELKPTAPSEAAAGEVDAEPDPEASPDQGAPAGDAPTTETPVALRGSAVVLDLPWSSPAGEAGGALKDLFVQPDSGAVVAVLVADAIGGEQLVKPDGLRWTAGRPPQLAAPLPAIHARELYAAEDLVELAGVVTELADAGSGARLMVRDEGNLLHRVDVPARDLLARALPALEVGITVRLRAAPSRDDEGKVWIPATITARDVSITLRNDQGAPIWGELCRDLRSARALLGAPIHHQDADWTVADWTFDPAGGRLASLELTGPGRSTTVPWDSLRPDWTW